MYYTLAIWETPDIILDCTPAMLDFARNSNPEAIRGQYQYFTQGSIDNLRRAGYNSGFTPLESAVDRYVTGYLDRADRYR